MGLNWEALICHTLDNYRHLEYRCLCKRPWNHCNLKFTQSDSKRVVIWTKGGHLPPYLTLLRPKGQPGQGSKLHRCFQLYTWCPCHSSHSCCMCWQFMLCVLARHTNMQDNMRVQQASKVPATCWFHKHFLWTELHSIINLAHNTAQ